MIQVRLNATVKNIHIDNGTEFVNQTLRSYYEDVGISHETSVGCTSKQNNVFERQNQTLVEAACTIALCYPTNNNEDMGKLKAKADIGIFIGYAPANVDYLVFVVATLEPADSTDTPSSTSIDQYAPSPIATPKSADSTSTPSLTSIDQYAPSPSTLQAPQESQSQVIPPNVEEAYHDIKIEAMQEELSEFELLEDWELVPRPDRVKIITLKWIYKVKLDKLGGVLKNKA
nr:hypothetical protein [Tanacetum cinerariifolium]